MAENSMNANNRLFLKLMIFVLIMIGVSFASVPLYDLFCRVTGYGGTTQKSSLAPGSSGNYKNIQINEEYDEIQIEELQLDTFSKI